MFKLRRQEFIILCSATSFFLPWIRIVTLKLQLLKAVEALNPHLALFDIAHHQEYWVVYQGMPWEKLLIRILAGWQIFRIFTEWKIFRILNGSKYSEYLPGEKYLEFWQGSENLSNDKYSEYWLGEKYSEYLLNEKYSEYWPGEKYSEYLLNEKHSEYWLGEKYSAYLPNEKSPGTNLISAARNSSLKPKISDLSSRRGITYGLKSKHSLKKSLH